MGSSLFSGRRLSPKAHVTSLRQRQRTGIKGGASFLGHQLRSSSAAGNMSLKVVQDPAFQVINQFVLSSPNIKSDKFSEETLNKTKLDAE